MRQIFSENPMYHVRWHHGKIEARLDDFLQKGSSIPVCYWIQCPLHNARLEQQNENDVGQVRIGFDLAKQHSDLVLFESIYVVDKDD
ncbi:hypothetical protein PssiTeo3_24460 [Pseudomonas sichuanensis]|nr:hypothetical protein [Pseudomonas sichuanensis]